MNGAESLLCSLLDCGYLDIQILDDVEYDLGEIAEQLMMQGIKPTLNRITGEIFWKGQCELNELLLEAIEETKSLIDEADEDTEEYERLTEKLEELETLDPENDIGWFCNCLDTSIWFSNNEEVYRKHLSQEIETVEGNMGFYF